MFNFLLPIQQALRPYDLDLQRAPFGNEFVWGVVNLNGDSIAELATTYSAEDVAAYKRIMGALSSSDNHRITAIEATVAIQFLDNKAIKYTASKAQALLNQFLEDRWLHQYEGSRGAIALGPKAVLDLREYLLDERLFDECKFCSGLIVLEGQIRCPGSTTGECPIVLHRHCAVTLETCPTCKLVLSIKDE